MVGLSRPYPYLPQILLGPFLNTLSYMLCKNNQRCSEKKILIGFLKNYREIFYKNKAVLWRSTKTFSAKILKGVLQIAGRSSTLRPQNEQFPCKN